MTTDYQFGKEINIKYVGIWTFRINYRLNHWQESLVCYFIKHAKKKNTINFDLVCRYLFHFKNEMSLESSALHRWETCFAHRRLLIDQLNKMGNEAKPTIIIRRKHSFFFLSSSSTNRPWITFNASNYPNSIEYTAYSIRFHREISEQIKCKLTGSSRT